MFNHPIWLQIGLHWIDGALILDLDIVDVILVPGFLFPDPLPQVKSIIQNAPLRNLKDYPIDTLREHSSWVTVRADRLAICIDDVKLLGSRQMEY